jgi:hypothetical protein
MLTPHLATTFVSFPPFNIGGLFHLLTVKSSGIFLQKHLGTDP